MWICDKIDPNFKKHECPSLAEYLKVEMIKADKSIRADQLLGRKKGFGPFLYWVWTGF